jgi:hypothetical protein
VNSLVGTGHLDKAAIVSAAGDSVWAQTPGFTVCLLLTSQDFLLVQKWHLYGYITSSNGDLLLKHIGFSNRIEGHHRWLERGGSGGQVLGRGCSHYWRKIRGNQSRGPEHLWSKSKLSQQVSYSICGRSRGEIQQRLTERFTKGKEGIVICKTTQAILVAHYGENGAAGNAAATVEKLADYLVGLGY